MPFAGLILFVYIRRPWVLVWMWPFGKHLQISGCFVHTFPFSLHAMLCLPCLFAPPVGFLCIFTCLLTHPCFSLACWCVVHASTQWSYGHSIQTYICPSWTPPFVCFLACLPSRLFACFLVSLLAMSIMLSTLCLFHILFASFPSIACLLGSRLCLCLYTHGERTHGARARSPKCKQKGRGCEYVDISQALFLVDLGV